MGRPAAASVRLTAVGRALSARTTARMDRPPVGDLLGARMPDWATAALPMRADARKAGRSGRARNFHEMYHAREGYLAVTNELLSLHVSERTRRGGRTIGLANRPAAPPPSSAR